MAYISPYILANLQGIPRIESNSVTINGNNVVYNFNFQRFLRFPYAGLIIFKLSSYTVPSASGTVTFNSPNATSVEVLNFAGVNVDSTNSNLAGGGIFLGFYENGNLRLLTGI